jgi:prolyl oligopeptidase
VSRRLDVSETLHGVTVHDPYRWLEDPRSPEVMNWAHSQDEFARRYLDRIPERPAIADRLKELLYAEQVQPYWTTTGGYFYRKRLAHHEHAALYTRKTLLGPEQLIVDPDSWAASSHKSFAEYWPSPNGRYVAISVSVNSSDDASVEVIEVSSTRSLETVAGARYKTVAWAADSSGFYYTYFLPTSEPSRLFAEAEVRFHRIGSYQGDATVAPRTNEAEAFQFVTVSEDGRWIILNKTIGSRRSSLWFRHSGSTGRWRVLTDGVDAHFTAMARGDFLYVSTNDGAPRRRLFRVSAARPERAAWTEIVPERADAVLDGMNLSKNKLVLRWQRPEGTELELRQLDGSKPQNVKLPGIGVVTVPGGLETSAEAFFSFESFMHPPEVFRLDTSTGNTTEVTRGAVPFDATDYVVENVGYASQDNSRGFIYIIHRKDVSRDGNAPTLLYGYGAHGTSLAPTYMPTLPAWLERGGVYAVAVVRGGGEFGEEWHLAATKKNKQKTFDDFIAAAEELVRTGWAKPERLGVIGSSAGGLLVAAVVTQRPELFRFGIAEAGLLDMVRYSMKGIGGRWVGEYGDPSKDDEFRYLLKYSPYHRVKAGVKYPAMLLLYPEADDRVDPMHTKKFAAAMQNASIGGPILLEVEKSMGHNVPDQQAIIVELKADIYAFALSQVAGENDSIANPEARP